MSVPRASAGSWTRHGAPAHAVALALALASIAPGAPGQEPASEPARPTRQATADDLLSAIDPAVSGWDTEVRVSQAEAQLQAIVESLERPPRDAGALEVCTEAFRWSAPAELVTAPESAAFRVRRGRGSAAPEASLARFLDRLRSDLGPVRDVRVRIETVEVEDGGDGLVTHARVHVGARAGTGPVQLDALWRCRWTLGPDGPPMLDGLEVLRQDQVVALQGALFSDCTEGLLGSLPAWREQLLPGLPEWRARLDSRLGLPLLGQAAGMAVGDVDGDGLEDLYLCQPGGMPNKLLLHRPDGAVVDASAEANVDFLDFSRTALLLDFDGDADRDLAVTVVDQLLLLSNDGRARFWLEAVLPAPDATSLAAADFDLDGDLDLYVGTYASPYDHSSLPVPCHDADNGKPDLFFVNHGQWVFEEAGAELGLQGRGFSLAASWEDFDRDGDPDVYVANDFGRDQLLRNDGGEFVDVAREAGVDQLAAGTGVAWGDLDGDGWMDLYVSNRSSAAAQRIVRQPRFQAGVGADVRTALERHARGNALLRNRGDGTFAEVTDSAHASSSRWTWGGIFCDLDGDGREDLLAPAGFLTEERTDDLSSFFWREVVGRSPLDGSAAEMDRASEYTSAWSALNRLLRQGHSWSGREPSGAFLGIGGAPGDFAEVSTCAGLDFTDDARATVRLDWDGDGDEDLFCTNRSGPRVRFLRNDRKTDPAWVTLELRGTRCNRDAIGARVELVLETERGRRTLVRSVRAGEGYLAQSSSRLTIGLGSPKASIRRVSVRWPGGASEDFAGVSPRGAFRLVEGAGRVEPLPRTPAKPLAASTPVAPPPATSARIVLARPVPLPSVKVVAADGQGLQLFGIQAGGTGTGTGKAVLLDLFSLDSAASRTELGALAARAGELGRSGIAFFALCVDGTERTAEVDAFLRELSWPFPWAFVLAESRRTLAGVQDIVLDRERPASTPQSLLVDASGRLRVVYLGALDPDRLLADRELLELGEGALLERATPFAGRWMFPALPSDADFFEARLAERGLVDAAREYTRGRLAVVQASAAELLHDFGRARAVEGKLDEAIDLFRRALATDPRHLDSLFDLAVVHHRREELVPAVALYQKVLALASDHADARFNLALALLGQGEREGAARQLAWLETHREESAAELRRILESTAPK